MTTKVTRNMLNTSIDDNGNATAITIDSSENAKFEGLVGINKDINASVALSVGADATSTTSYGLEVTNSTANTRFLVNGEGSSIFYKTDNAEGMRFNASTGGLTFGGDTAAANTLDDYEEGDFTPSIVGASTAGTFTYGGQQGKYTKIGNTVIVNIYIYVSATSTSPSGNITVQGLPFATANAHPSFAIGWTQNIAFSDQLAAYGGGGTNIILRNMLNGSTGTQIVGSNFGSTFYLFLTGSYKA